MVMNTQALGVVAAGTGEGKTLAALALARALVKAGYRVAPFKCGPDYIDARLYQVACGQPARNLDLWLDSPERVTRAIARAQGAAVVIEGMMGLFDGDDLGATSSAHVLAQLDVPALLVVDGWRMSQTAAAVALGCALMEPHVRIAGIVLNRAGGQKHVGSVRRACDRAGIELLAALPYRAGWTIPQRRHGLDLRRPDAIAAIVDDAADSLAGQLDLRAFFGEPSDAPDVPRESAGDGPLIAVAHDEALWFTYPETIDALRSAGARCAFFSPLRDERLPPQARGLWLGGGYPEAHAGELAANAAMRRAVRSAAGGGMPVYAECGGLMYLAERLETPHGEFPMVGAVRGRSSTARPRLHMGYRRMRARRSSILDHAGDEVRAHEFHYASGSFEEEPAYEGDGDCGVWRESLLAGFLHRRFFEGDPTVCRFVERCSS
jgi:cobyrinic acid a,c-diamide synthase